MFLRTPKVLAYKTCTEKGNFVTPEYIINNNVDSYNLFHRFCPHRMYPLSAPGQHVHDITCQFHNFKWSSNGEPLNNDKKLKCGSASPGKSGLLFKDFAEPDHQWVNDLTKENNLIYSHSLLGTSHGSWLWLMDAEADLLHLHKDGIHPFLSKQINLDDIKMDQGDGWIIQNHPDGWWLYIFPYGFVEYGRPGKLMVNSIFPKDPDNEFGFDWITQFYYDPSIDVNQRMIFETLETVFKEDVKTAEVQKGKYFPVMKSVNRYEDHCVYWGQWFKTNLKK